METVRIACARCISGRTARSMILTGQKGACKAALLTEIAHVAEDGKLLISHIALSNDESIALPLYPEMLRVLQSLATVETARHLANLGLCGLRSFTTAYRLGSEDLLAGIDPELGLADSGTLENDLSELFDVIGQAAKAARLGWALLIDDMHCLSEEEMSALIAAIHRVAQGTLPILLIGTGDPLIVRLVGDAKPYAERLFLFLSADG